MDLVTLELVGAPGAPAAKVTRKRSSAAALDAENPLAGVWYFSSAATKALPPGNYRVRARFEDYRFACSRAISASSILRASSRGPPKAPYGTSPSFLYWRFISLQACDRYAASK